MEIEESEETQVGRSRSNDCIAESGRRDGLPKVWPNDIDLIRTRFQAALTSLEPLLQPVDREQVIEKYSTSGSIHCCLL